VMVSGESQR